MSSLIPPLFRGDMSISLLLRAEIIVEWFQMEWLWLAIYYVTWPPHPIPLFSPWSHTNALHMEVTYQNSLRALFTCIYFSGGYC